MKYIILRGYIKFGKLYDVELGIFKEDEIDIRKQDRIRKELDFVLQSIKDESADFYIGENKGCVSGGTIGIKIHCLPVGIDNVEDDIIKYVELKTEQI